MARSAVCSRERERESTLSITANWRERPLWGVACSLNRTRTFLRTLPLLPPPFRAPYITYSDAILGSHEYLRGHLYSYRCLYLYFYLYLYLTMNIKVGRWRGGEGEGRRTSCDNDNVGKELADKGSVKKNAWKCISLATYERHDRLDISDKREKKGRWFLCPKKKHNTLR